MRVRLRLPSRQDTSFQSCKTNSEESKCYRTVLYGFCLFASWHIGAALALLNDEVASWSPWLSALRCPTFRFTGPCFEDNLDTALINCPSLLESLHTQIDRTNSAHIACHSHLRTTVLPHKRQIDSALNIDTCAASWEHMRNKGHSPVDVDHNTQRCSVDWHGVLDTGPHTPESIQSAKQSPAKQQQHAAASVAARARSSLCLIAMRVPVTAKYMQDETVRRHKWWSCSQQYTSVVSDHRIFHAQHGARSCAIADRHLLAWNALFRLCAVVTTWFPARDTFRKLPQKLICAGLV